VRYKPQVPAGNPQIAAVKAGWNTGFRPVPVGETPQRNTGRDMVLESGGHVKAIKAMAEDSAESAHMLSDRSQPTALCRCSGEQMKVL